MTTESIRSHVEILYVDDSHHRDHADLLRVSSEILDLVKVVAPSSSAAFLPADGAIAFAFSGTFGSVDVEMALSSIRTQILSPEYRLQFGVFPLIRMGDWTIEVIHPSPPGSSQVVGVMMSGPVASTEVERRIATYRGGLTPAQAGGASGSTSTETLVEPLPPSLSQRLQALGQGRSRLLWPAEFGIEIGGIGARIYPDPSVLAAVGATTLLELYASAARSFSITRMLRCAPSWTQLRGLSTYGRSSVRLMTQSPSGSNPSLDQILEHLASPAVIPSGYLQVEMLSGPESTSRLAALPPVAANVVREWFFELDDITTRLRIMELADFRLADARWRWLEIGR